MITEITIENFKRFRSSSLRTANLTVLTGTNGAGKTSVFHSLLLARQIARNPNRAHVELNGIDTLELGGPEDIIYREASENTARIEIFDSDHKRSFWTFGSSSSSQSNTLYATIFERHEDYSGALIKPAPHFCYLSAERLGPRDVLGTSASNMMELDVGARGEFVAQVLAHLDRSMVSGGRLVVQQASSSTLLQETEKWLGEIIRPIQIEAQAFPETMVTRLSFKTPGVRSEWTRAPNVGFGISYALPIIVAALRAKSDGLVLLENPEAHLHPSGQSKIGAFLAQVAADGVQIFLETHSDHVLNGIRVAIANGSAKLSAEQVAILYFRAAEEKGPALESLELQETGRIKAWPKGFFDQSQIDLRALASVRKTRQR